jgi:hypothetical protein
MDRTAQAVWDRAVYLGLDKRSEEHRPWSQSELDEVRRCYPAERPSDIARRLGRTTSAVSQQAKVLGVVSRKALISIATVHSYFDEVTTAEQAYVLGLIAADGNVATGYPRVQLGLQAKDAHLVEWVRDRLSPRMPLSVRPDGHAVLMVTSAEMVSALARYGIVPRKSATLPWPGDLGPLQLPFLLGYFDGDGSACLARGEYPNWSACSGSEKFLIGLKAYVLAETGVVMQRIQHRRGTGLYQVATQGRTALVIDGWVHQEGLGLARKRFPEHVRARYGH